MDWISLDAASVSVQGQVETQEAPGDELGRSEKIRDGATSIARSASHQWTNAGR